MDRFRVRVTLAKGFDAYSLQTWTPDEGYKDSWSEPAEAIDAAEEELSSQDSAIPAEAFAEIVFNSDTEPHYRVFLLEPIREGQSHFGLFNTASAKWEVNYPPGYGENMPLPPPWFTEDTGEGAVKETEKEDEGEHKKDNDADTMDLGGEDDDENEMDDDEPDGDDGEDEDESEGDDEGEKNEDSDSDSEGEEDAEMPRLKLFSKLRGPKGWRKRAESDHERDYNRFEFVLGVLDEDAPRASRQERDKRVRVTVIERDENRETATLRIQVPESADLTWSQKGGVQVLSGEIPLHDHEED